MNTVRIPGRRNWLPPLRTPYTGRAILMDPLYNKGVAFKPGERDRLGLRGLLPPRRLRMTDQILRFMRYLRSMDSDIAKNRALEDLHDRNETLYHRILVDHTAEIAPIVYTPTVGKACLEYSSQYRKPRGLYISLEDRGHIGAMVHNVPLNDIHVIVVTDGARILGLGDIGVNGMGIPIGKLSLYCAIGGVAPFRVLPVVIDVGTNNAALREDPFYLGLQTPRISGTEYYSLVDEFMHAVRHRWPSALVQFEDFSSEHAQTLLDHYRHNFFCFNDDIQGTGAVTLAGLMCGLRAKGQAPTDLLTQRILIAGAGSAGVGVANELLRGMVYQGANEEEARSRIRLVDADGLVGQRDNLPPALAKFAASEGENGKSLLDTIESHKPNVLFGLTACAGLFREPHVRAMAAINDRPIIFALSNPTDRAECTAEEAYTWTDGRAIFASGSPFQPVTLNGVTHTPSQCNNMFIFPALGFGVTLAGAGTVSDEMLYVAAKALAETTSSEELAAGSVFPALSRVRDVSVIIATAVVEHCIKVGRAPRLKKRHIEVEGVANFVRRKMYDPVYVPIVGGHWGRSAV